MVAEAPHRLHLTVLFFVRLIGKKDIGREGSSALCDVTLVWWLTVWRRQFTGRVRWWVLRLIFLCLALKRRQFTGSVRYWQLA